MKLLETWLAASGEAWFFLDSVDEARLNRKSFDTALKLFARDLGTGLERAHVYVSCRVTDWKGADDRTTYMRYLPAWESPPARTGGRERHASVPECYNAPILQPESLSQTISYCGEGS